MSTNTTDPYVPALSRHIFTAGGCSNGSHNQPQFNESNGAFTETWDGYIYVPETMDNVKLKVSADDNACFYLYAFPDNKANLPGRGPLGGGSYASAESTPIAHLEKGYYRVNVTYENIDYPGANVSRLDVLLNGTQISIGQLETHNLLSSQKAFEVYDFYTPVNYDVESVDVWAMFDKTDINTQTPGDNENEDSTGDKEEDSTGDKEEDSTGDKEEDSTGDKEEDSTGDKEEDSTGDKEGDSTGDKEKEAVMSVTENETATVAEVMANENSCATRVSIALSRSGFPIKNGPGANNVHLLNSDLRDQSGKSVKWHNACLRPDGIHNEIDKANYSHFISSADNMGTFLTNVFGAPDYTSLSQYQAEYNVGELFPDDIIIFHNPYKAERGWGHVGIGHSPTYDEGSIKDIDETNIWIIHRASWGEPASN